MRMNLTKMAAELHKEHGDHVPMFEVDDAVHAHMPEMDEENMTHRQVEAWYERCEDLVAKLLEICDEGLEADYSNQHDTD
jgi:hypothetical protein